MQRMLGRSYIPALCLLISLAGVSGISAQEDRDALVEYRRGNYQTAVEITTEEIQDNPNRLDAYVVLGWSLLALNRPEEARERAERALRLNRRDARVLHILGESHYRLENYEQAIQYLQEYIAVNPQGSLRAQVYFFLGDIFYRIGEYHHADIALTAAVTYSDLVPRWWALLGQAREEAGNLQQARVAYEQALELQPDFSEAQNGLDRLSQ